MSTERYSRRVWLQSLTLVGVSPGLATPVGAAEPSQGQPGAFPVRAGETDVRATHFPYGDVRRHGATGTGATDDTAAIQAALDSAHAAGIGEVVIPAGIYSVGALTVPGDNIVIRGAGSGYGYNSMTAPHTTLRARRSVPHMLNLVSNERSGEGRQGCWITGLRLDGDLKADNGINVLGANVIDGCLVRGCLNAGLRLANYANATRISRCALLQNHGWGLIAEGSGTTTFSVLDSNISLNQAGGLQLLAGVLVRFTNVVIESNGGAGLRLFRPDGMDGSMSGYHFDSCWFEDNRGPFAIEIDSHARRESSAPWRVRFSNCRLNTSAAARRHLRILCARWVTFQDCQFDSLGPSPRDTLTLGAEARHVAFIDSARAPGFTGLSDAQLDVAISQGTRCWWSDRETRRAVGRPGQPAFLNGWQNAGRGHAEAQFWFDRDGNVELRGAITAGTIGTSAFVLPRGYRPAATHRFPATADGAAGEIEVQPSGAVIARVGGTGLFSFHGITFPTG